MENMRLASEVEIRTLQMELLHSFDSFCRQHQLKYFAFCGTLLGAVRHKGFIPWDDDVDLAMSRDHYNCLISLLKDEDAHPLFRLLCYENDHSFYWQFGKLVHKKTRMKTRNGHPQLGLNIDIFPLDNQGESRLEAEKLLSKVRKCVMFRRMAYNKRCGALSYVGRTVYERLEKYWVRRHIMLAQSKNNKADTKYYGSNSNELHGGALKREFFDEVIMLNFENFKIPVPSGYKEILTTYYGDYLTPVREYQMNNNNSIFLHTAIDIKT